MLTVIYLLILAIRAGILSRSKISTELKATEQLLQQEKKYYNEVKNNVEIINMKCHDIIRQLSSFQGKLTNSELSALKDAIKIYDSNIKTGNTVLDTILYQKKLYCDNNGIKLDCLADGKVLSFITPADIYALIANIIENAVEAVLKLDSDKRIINLNVSGKQGYVIIESTNYYDNALIISGDTSKSDKIHHGYGLKSIAYIAKKYNGSIDISTPDDIFDLTVSIPISDQSAHHPLIQHQ